MTNTDDFIWRLVKGCVQLGLIPDINNTINMVPVDHVARCTVLSAIEPPPPKSAKVHHITSRPSIRFNELLDSLSVFGYNVERCEYVIWRGKLEKHVMEVQDNALFPLLHFVLDDLPTSTKAPELNDQNTFDLLKKYGEEKGGVVDQQLIGRYIAWLVSATFLPKPSGEGKLPLPQLDGPSAKAVGRSGR